MKTSEFIERVENIGYKTVKTDWYINIYDKYNITEQVAWVEMYDERQLSISDAFYDLTKLLIEYAETPLAEREDDKKYYVKVPHTEDVWYYKSWDGKLETVCQYGNKHRITFTEAEIEHYGLQDCERVESD